MNTIYNDVVALYNNKSQEEESQEEESQEEENKSLNNINRIHTRKSL